MENKKVTAVVEKPQEASLPVLVETAITKGASVEVIEKLLALQERYDANQAKKAFSQAISDVRSKLPQIVKDRNVDFTTARGRTHYKYEDLCSVVDAIAPVLADHGLSFRWRTRSDDKMVYVTCILSHAQGHSEETELSCRHDESGNKNPIQAIGSGVTYLQRYTLKAAIGIAASQDDDGQSAGTNQIRRQQHNQGITVTAAHLATAILDHVNNDKAAAQQILQNLIGKTTCAGLSPTEAAKAYKLFEQKYLNAAPSDDGTDFDWERAQREHDQQD